MIGEKVLGYTVDEKIGSGGFGTVYRVSKTNASGKYVRALKHITIPSQKQYIDILNSMGGDYSKANDYFAGVLKEIVNEIQIISTLSETGTKNIVRYYENDIIENDSPKKYDIYILMECLTPFNEYFYNHELQVKDVIRLGKDILTALISCHDNHIIHRDIKDDNIFVSSDGTYKLGDFGVSKLLKDRSRAESMKGTPNFIAPEVYLGKEQYDNTVDIYSLGIVLYKLLNKSRNPFMPDFPQGYNSDDEDAAFEKRMKGEIPPLPFDAKNALGEAIVKAVSTRNLRYNTANEFLTAISNAEKEIDKDEMEKSVNLTAAQYNDKKEEKISVSRQMDETIGTDIDISIGRKKEMKSDSNLFETVSDTFNRDPVQVQPAIDAGENYKGQGAATKFESEPSSAYGSKKYSNSEPVQVEAVKKSDFRWAAFALPIEIIIIYIVLYLIIIPGAYGKGISLGKWMFNSPDEILTVLQDQNAVIMPIYKILALKVLMYVLWVAFIASLFNLGRIIQNKKANYNINAVLKNKEPYLKMMEINESISRISNPDVNKARTAVRNIMEHLRNETDFGIGNDAVIACERDIARCLNAIEENIRALYNEKTAKESADVIIEDCKTIQARLKIRTEMKKR